VCVLPKALDRSRETWGAMHENLRNSNLCRVVFDALAVGLSDYIKTPGATGRRRAAIRPSPDRKDRL
jgi:hypothetical protein